MEQIIATGWTLEQSDVLKELVLSGLSYAKSAAQINARFNTNYSRNAAIGRANRIGLACPPQPAMAKKKRVYIYKPRERKSKQKYSSIAQRFYEAVENPETIELRCAEIVPRGLTLLELEPGDCRYPYGTGDNGEAYTFCAHPKMLGSSYCWSHFHLTRKVDARPPNKLLVSA